MPPVLPGEHGANLPALVAPAGESLGYWHATVSEATNTVLVGMANHRRNGDAIVALLRAIDGATEALGTDGDATMREAVKAALKTARTASIAAQEVVRPYGREAVIEELTAGIDKTLSDVGNHKGEELVAYLRAALRGALPRRARPTTPLLRPQPISKAP